jgi:hypothetical protein
MGNVALAIVRQVLPPQQLRNVAYFKIVQSHRAFPVKSLLCASENPRPLSFVR